MPKINNFEDLQCWQQARILVKLIYSATSQNPFRRDFSLKDQIRRSAVSVMANIAEGFGRRTDKEFANFLNIALGSVSEVKNHLYVALDLNYISKSKFEYFYNQSTAVAKLVSGLIRYIRTE